MCPVDAAPLKTLFSDDRKRFVGFTRKSITPAIAPESDYNFPEDHKRTRKVNVGGRFNVRFVLWIVDGLRPNTFILIFYLQTESKVGVTKGKKSAGDKIVLAFQRQQSKAKAEHLQPSVPSCDRSDDLEPKGTSDDLETVKEPSDDLETIVTIEDPFVIQKSSLEIGVSFSF